MLLTEIVINQIIIGKSQHSKVVLTKDREDHKTSSTWSAGTEVVKSHRHMWPWSPTFPDACVDDDHEEGAAAAVEVVAVAACGGETRRWRLIHGRSGRTPPAEVNCGGERWDLGAADRLGGLGYSIVGVLCCPGLCWTDLTWASDVWCESTWPCA